MSIEQFLCKVSTIPSTLKEASSTQIEISVEEALQEESLDISEPVTDSTSEDSPYNIDETNYIENTLIISETRHKVILPYKLSALKNILQQNELYTSIDDVIDKLYTLPIEYYRFTPIARFKEGFKLVKEKAKGSKIKALALGFELFTNYNLHPAIITACNNIDELDIYLACLEENNLDDFHFFNIIYEIPLANCPPNPSL